MSYYIFGTAVCYPEYLVPQPTPVLEGFPIYMNPSRTPSFDSAISVEESATNISTRLPSASSVDIITPDILTASQEISQFCSTLRVPTKVLFMNFMKYVERVHIPVSTENFLYYLRNWADLDLRITKIDKEERKEIFLKKFQSADENGGNRKVKTCELRGTTYFGLAETEKPIKAEEKPARRDWVTRGPYAKFLKMKKEAEEFEKRFTI